MCTPTVRNDVVPSAIIAAQSHDIVHGIELCGAMTSFPAAGTHCAMCTYYQRCCQILGNMTSSGTLSRVYPTLGFYLWILTLTLILTPLILAGSAEIWVELSSTVSVCSTLAVALSKRAEKKLNKNKNFAARTSKAHWWFFFKKFCSYKEMIFHC